MESVRSEILPTSGHHQCAHKRYIQSNALWANRTINISKEVGRVAYEVVKGDNSTPRVKIDDRLYSPQEISAMVLQKMKKNS
jgi:molecular chaperone DnaK